MRAKLPANFGATDISCSANYQSFQPHFATVTGTTFVAYGDLGSADAGAVTVTPEADSPDTTPQPGVPVTGLPSTGSGGTGTGLSTLLVLTAATLLIGWEVRGRTNKQSAR